MNYFIDCEFDGHNGPLLSIGIVPEDHRPQAGLAKTGLYIAIDRPPALVRDPWVRDNVLPRTEADVSDIQRNAFVVMQSTLARARTAVQTYFRQDRSAQVWADSVVDIARLCRLLSTDEYGKYKSFDGDILFAVWDVDVYSKAFMDPADPAHARRHNAYWDAMALRNAYLSRDL